MKGWKHSRDANKRIAEVQLVRNALKEISKGNPRSIYNIAGSHKRLGDLEKLTWAVVELEKGTVFYDSISSLVVNVLVKAGIVEVLEDVVIKDDDTISKSMKTKDVTSNATIETTGLEYEKAEVGVKLKKLLKKKVPKTEVK